MLLARIAVWEVLPPTSATIPLTLAESNAAISEVVISFPTRITSPTKFNRSSSGFPCKIFVSRKPISRTSAARSRRYGSSSPAKISVCSAIVSCTAFNAENSCVPILSRTPSSRVGSASIRHWASMISVRILSPLRRARCRMTSSCAVAWTTASPKRRNSVSICSGMMV